jgi:hypothetical protein
LTIAILLGLVLAVASACHLVVHPSGTSLAICVTLTIAAVISGWSITYVYMRERYADGPHAWIDGVDGARIGVAGSTGSYPLFGREFSNRVEQLSQPHDRHGSFLPIESCGAWRRALAKGGFDYVVTSPRLTTGTPPRWYLGHYFGTYKPEEGWTRSYAAARLVRRESEDVMVFRLTKPGTRGLYRGCNRTEPTF